MLGDDDHQIFGHYLIAAVGNDDLSRAADADDLQIVFQVKVHYRSADNARACFYAELQRLYLILVKLVEGLDIAAHGVLHGADITRDVFAREHLGVHDALKPQLVDDSVKGFVVDLGDDLSLGNALDIQRDQDVFLVVIHQSRHAVNVFDALAEKQLLIHAVAVNDGCAVQRFGKLGAAFLVALDDLDVDACLEQLLCQIERHLAAAQQDNVAASAD